MLTVDPHLWIRSAEKEKALFRSIAQRKISKMTAQNALEPLRLTGDNSWVLQWHVLCGIPYRGSGALASPDPTNSHYNLLPTSLYGADQSGHREALLLICNFQRLTQQSSICKPHIFSYRASLLLLRNCALLRLPNSSRCCLSLQASSCCFQQHLVATSQQYQPV